jgi:hypothetical protein
MFQFAVEIGQISHSPFHLTRRFIQMFDCLTFVQRSIANLKEQYQHTFLENMILQLFKDPGVVERAPICNT